MDASRKDDEVQSSFLKTADSWALQQLQAESNTAKPRDEVSVDRPNLCSACHDIDFSAAIKAAEADGIRRARLLCKQKQLDDDCALCSLLGSHVFGTGMDSEKAPHNHWAMISYWFEGLALGGHTSNLFKPMRNAVLSPGTNVRHIKSHRERSENLCRGLLAVARTASLKEYFLDPDIAIGPRTCLLQPTYSPALVRAWMEQVSEADLPQNTSPKICGMQLVDCEKYLVVDMQDDMAYLALSYVWALANGDLVPLLGRDTTSTVDHADNPKSLPPTIPRVIANAMAVTTDLGFRYLWVDQYCIDQDAGQEALYEHISQMDQVYMSAKLTIVAASTCGALPGVQDTSRPRQVLLNVPGRRGEVEPPRGDRGFTIFTTSPDALECVQRSPWYQRGWCFQESALSSARLYFTDHEMLFQTRSSMLSETYPVGHELMGTVMVDQREELPLSPPRWRERVRDQDWGRHMRPFEDPRGRFSAELQLFMRLIRVYTSKQLSHDSDSINAFRGVLKHFARMNPDFGTIAGIPLFLAAGDEDIRRLPRHAQDGDAAEIHDKKEAIPTSGLTGCEVRDFRHQMLTTLLIWRHEWWDEHERLALRRRPEFPSWSWAGWQGSVVWDTLSMRQMFSKTDGEVDEDQEDEEDEYSEGRDVDSDESDETIQHVDTNSTHSSSYSSERPHSTTSSSSSSSSSTPSSFTASSFDFDWRIHSLECKSGRTISLDEAPAHFALRTATSLGTERRQHHQKHIGDARYLIGEAYLLPPEKIFLMHTWSTLPELSRLYSVCSKARNAARNMKRLVDSVRLYTSQKVFHLSSKSPALRWLRHIRSGQVKSRPRPSAEQSAKDPRHKLYHLSRRLASWSGLYDILRQVYVDHVMFSDAELVGLPQKSQELEQRMRSHLDDGSWGLLAVDSQVCLVVEWGDHQIDTIGRKGDDGDEKDNQHENGEPRLCFRVGVLRFHHFLGRLSGVGDADIIDLFEDATRVKFRLG